MSVCKAQDKGASKPSAFINVKGLLLCFIPFREQNILMFLAVQNQGKFKLICIKIPEKRMFHCQSQPQPCEFSQPTMIVRNLLCMLMESFPVFILMYLLVMLHV